MASIDDWILQSTGNLLGDAMVPDDSKYAQELLNQYKNITGIDPYSDDVTQEYKQGGYEQWVGMGMQPLSGTKAQIDTILQNQGTAENLSKFGYTAPMMSQEDVINRDLAGGEYATYAGGINASNAAQSTADKNASVSSITDEFALLKGNKNAQQNFATKYGLNPLNFAYGPNDDFLATMSEDQIASLGGYVPTDSPVKSQEDYYSGKYGTEFTQDQINSALTGRYGELQEAPVMGAGWMNIYHTFNKWEQEDAMFKDEMTGLQDEIFPQMEAQQKAMMASGGMETGTDQWNRNLENIQSQRMDVEAEVAERKNALENTSIYESLQNQYKEMRGDKEMRGIQKNETRYRDVSSFVEATEKYTGPRYGRDSETGKEIVISDGYWTDHPAHYETTSKPYEASYTQGTETGNLLYGVGEGRNTAPSFDEFFQSQFGLAENVGNPYTKTSGISNQEETENDKQARRASSGVAME